MFIKCCCHVKASGTKFSTLRLVARVKMVRNLVPSYRSIYSKGAQALGNAEQFDPVVSATDSAEAFQDKTRPSQHHTNEKFKIDGFIHSSCWE